MARSGGDAVEILVDDAALLSRIRRQGVWHEKRQAGGKAGLPASSGDGSDRSMVLALKNPYKRQIVIRDHDGPTLSEGTVLARGDEKCFLVAGYRRSANSAISVLGDIRTLSAAELRKNYKRVEISQWADLDRSTLGF